MFKKRDWEKRNTKVIRVEGKRIRVDPIISNLIIYINFGSARTLASCSGHRIYNPSIICENKETPRIFYDIISGKIIHRKRRFYVRDKKGFYYLPEVYPKGEKG